MEVPRCCQQRWLRSFLVMLSRVFAHLKKMARLNAENADKRTKTVLFCCSLLVLNNHRHQSLVQRKRITAPGKEGTWGYVHRQALFTSVPPGWHHCHLGDRRLINNQMRGLTKILVSSGISTVVVILRAQKDMSTVLWWFLVCNYFQRICNNSCMYVNRFEI